MKERLQKIISGHGICSRRAAEKLIADGRVKLNGAVAEIGMSADIESDIIEVDGKVLGGAVTALLLSILMALVAVVAGVLNFFVVLIGAINLNWLFNVILNAVSLVTWGLSALFLSQFTAQCADLSLGLFSGSVSPFYLVGIGLFLLDLVVDLVVGLSLRKQKKNQPTMDEAVEIELNELREGATA